MADPLEVLLCKTRRPNLTAEHPSSQEAWRSETVQALLQGITTEQAFDRLPILADALEEAGCHDELLLRHCRECTEHYEFCWVLSEGLPKPLPRPVVPVVLPPQPVYRRVVRSDRIDEESEGSIGLSKVFGHLLVMQVLAMLCCAALSCHSEPDPVPTPPVGLKASQYAKQDYPPSEDELKRHTGYTPATHEMLRKALEKSEKKP